MVKRRQASPIKISSEQRKRLEWLWFHSGNYGPKSTPGNHRFIQRILENGIDERSLYTKRTPKLEIPTAECEAAVEAILSRTWNILSGRKAGFMMVSHHGRESEYELQLS
jgi:hypothetical protein